MSRVTAAVTLTAVAAIAVAGCSSPATPAVSPDGAFTELVDTYLNDSAASGYGDEQVATLEHAREVGSLAYEDYAAAVEQSLDCITAAGYQVERRPDDSGGVPMVNYSYEGPETGNPVADECIYVHSQAIEAIYQLQPSSVEASQAHLKEVAGQFAACLQAMGIEANFDGLEGDELVEAVHHYDSELALEAVDTGVPPPCSSAVSY